MKVRKKVSEEIMWGRKLVNWELVKWKGKRQETSGRTQKSYNRRERERDMIEERTARVQVRTHANKAANQ